jgi:hypothetical protein
MAFWWIVGRNSWDNAWGDASFVFKALGFIFAPWTILMFLAVGGEPIDGWEWLLIGLGILADVSGWANFFQRRARQVPEKYQQYVPAQLQ